MIVPKSLKTMTIPVAVDRELMPRAKRLGGASVIT